MVSYNEEDIIKLPLQPEIAKALWKYGIENHKHLGLTVKDISHVLMLLSSYCVTEGAKAKPKIYDETHLRMIQWEDPFGRGTRLETWGISERSRE